MAATSARQYFQQGQQRIIQRDYPTDNSCMCRMGHHITDDYRITHRHKCTACQEMALFFDTNSSLLGIHSYDVTPVKSSLEPDVMKWLTVHVSSTPSSACDSDCSTATMSLWHDLLQQVPTIHNCQPDIRQTLQQLRLPAVQSAVKVAQHVYGLLELQLVPVNAASCHDYTLLALNHPEPVAPVKVTPDNAESLLKQLGVMFQRLQPYQFCHNTPGLEGFVMMGDRLIPWHLERDSITIQDQHVSPSRRHHAVEDWGKHIELKQQCWYGGNQCTNDALVTSIKLTSTGVKMWRYYRHMGLPMLCGTLELYTTIASIIAAVDNPTVAMRRLWLSMWEPGKTPDITTAAEMTHFYQLAGYHIRCDIAGMLANMS